MSDKNEPTLLHRLARKYGEPFGLRWLSRTQVAVVMQHEKFHHIASGPGYVLITPGIQRIALVVDTAPDRLDYVVDDVLLEDGVAVQMHTKLMYIYDPRNVPKDGPDAGNILLLLKDRVNCRDFVALHAQRAMRVAVSPFNTMHVSHGATLQEVEKGFLALLGEYLQPLGMRLFTQGCAVTNVYLPEAVNKQFEEVSRHRVSLEHLGAYERYELDEIRKLEMIEVLKRMPGGTFYVNVNDIAGGEAGPQKPRLVQGKGKALPKPGKNRSKMV